MSSPGPISVVIRTTNSAPELRRLLALLKLNSGDEVIVVDTASRDGTVAFVKEVGARLIRNADDFNYSRTLNLGFAVARNEWILALSSHCVPIVEDLLGSYRAALAASAEVPAIVSGTNVLSRQQYGRTKRPDLIERLVPLKTPWAGNSNCLYSRQAWQRHRFDESLPTGEDLEWRDWALGEELLCLRALQAAVLYHHAGSPLYRFRKGCIEVHVRAPQVVPMTFPQLGLALAQATRRLLLEERSLSCWLGQVAHYLGVFVTGRSYR